MNRFREKLKNVDFGPQNTLFTPSWKEWEFISKNELRHFYVFIDSQHYPINKWKKIKSHPEKRVL